MNKKGGEKYISIWWVLALVLVTVGIVAGVLLFFQRDVDVRAVESDILLSRIADCSIVNGQINPILMQEILNKEAFLKECSISNDMIIQGNTANLYLGIQIYKFENYDNQNEDNNIVFKKIDFGENVLTDCKIAESMKKATNYPLCSDRYVYGLSSGEKYILHIYAGSNQHGIKISSFQQ